MNQYYPVGTTVKITAGFYKNHPEIPALRMHWTITEVINYDLPAYEIAYPPLRVYIAHEYVEAITYD